MTCNKYLVCQTVLQPLTLPNACSSTLLPTPLLPHSLILFYSIPSFLLSYLLCELLRLEPHFCRIYQQIPGLEKCLEVRQVFLICYLQSKVDSKEKMDLQIPIFSSNSLTLQFGLKSSFYQYLFGGMHQKGDQEKQKEKAVLITCSKTMEEP